MSEVNATNSGGLDQPHVTPTDERDKGPQGFTPSIAQELRDRAIESRRLINVVVGSADEWSTWSRARAALLEDLANQAERERWTREHDRTA